VKSEGAKRCKQCKWNGTKEGREVGREGAEGASDWAAKVGMGGGVVLRLMRNFLFVMAGK
jgi:hypothetical protein